MGAGKSMLDSCLLDHRSWFAPSNSCSKHACVLWGTSKSVAEAKLCETKAETYQVKKPGGRAGLRKFARAMRSMFGSVRAARALQDVSMCLSTRALARKSSW